VALAFEDRDSLEASVAPVLEVDSLFSLDRDLLVAAVSVVVAAVVTVEAPKAPPA
jgi:hypothetical protein